MCDRISPLVFVFVTAAAGMVPCASASPQDSAVASVWGEVHGALTDPLGAPLAGVPLQLALPWIRVASTTTDAAGRFHIAQVPPGDYWLELLTTDLVFTRAVEVAVTSATAVHLEPVTALKAASLGGRVVLELGGGPVADTLVRGVVTDASTGQPIPGVRVSVAGPMVPGSPGFREPMIEGHYWQRVYQTSGEHVLQLAAGEWKVEATRDGYVPTDRRQERPSPPFRPARWNEVLLQPSHTFPAWFGTPSTGEPLPTSGLPLGRAST
ncbi:carboxypeptidase regulatory-like domain-containing protein [bacterium]|nr:carboxypeptidase regulatory-like domain-containing protein [bacterium]